MTEMQRRNRLIWPDAAAFLAVATAIQIVVGNFTFPPASDEIYHLLAARSWLSDGTLAVGDGAYTRAAGYTILLALVQSVFGDSLIVARGLSTAFGVMWVLALFCWLWTIGGRAVAWIAALLLTADPEFLELSHFIRFYTLHGFVFLLGSWGWYSAVTRRFASPGAVAAAVGSVAALGVALHLQLTTMIGVAGLGLWTAIELGPSCIAGPRANRRRVIEGVVVMVLILAGIFVARAWLVETIETAWRIYRWAAVWAVGNQNNYLFYFDLFLGRYPVFWALFPIAALLAVRRDARFGVFCVTVFGVAFVLQSFGGMKGARYLYYAVPFFFAITAMGLCAVAASVRSLVDTATARLLGDRMPSNWLRAGRLACYGAIAVFLVAGTPAMRVTVKMAREWPLYRLEASTDWPDAANALKPLLVRSQVLLTPDGQQALYYLGRADYLVARMKVDESRSGSEFGMDRRTGLPAISTPQSFRRIMSCYATGLFVANISNWRHRVGGATDEVADLIESEMREIEIPARWGLRVFAWEHAGWSDPPPECADLPRRSGMR